MAATSLARQPWRAAPGENQGLPSAAGPGQTPLLSLKVPGMAAPPLWTVWEGSRVPVRWAASLSLRPGQAGPQWLEAEALWPDGRRAFAVFRWRQSADGSVKPLPKGAAVWPRVWGLNPLLW